MGLPRASFIHPNMATKPTAVIAIGVDEKPAPKPSEKGLKLPPVEGLEPSEDAEPGEDQSFMCSVRWDDEGNLYLTELDGKPVTAAAPPPPDEPEEEQPSRVTKSPMRREFDRLMQSKAT